MTRDEAVEILNSLITNPNLLKHAFAVEAVMTALAVYFKTNTSYKEIDESKWALTGLLHDADYDITRDQPERHTLVLQEKFSAKLDSNILHAIRAHNYAYSKIAPQTLMDWSLYCCDDLTGLITACALVLPDKKLASLTSDFVLNKFNEKSFAKGANRDQMKLCQEKLGLSLKAFIDIALTAMQRISLQLGL